MKMSAPILTGSEFVLPTKVRISPEEQSRVAAGLKEAIEDNKYFFKKWPTYEDPRMVPPPPPSPKMFIGPPPMVCPPKTKSPSDTKAQVPTTQNQKANDKKSINKVKQQQPEASALYTRVLTASETSRRERIKKQWEQKGERDISKRGRVEGGLEDTVENAMLADLSMFTPTLYGVQFQPGEVVLGWSDRVVRPGDQRGVKGMEESVRGLAIEGEDSGGDEDDEEDVFADAESEIEDGEGRGGDRDRGKGMERSRDKERREKRQCYRKEKPKSKQEEGVQEHSESEASFRRLSRVRRRSKPMEHEQKEPRQSLWEKEQSSDNFAKSRYQQGPTSRRESGEESDNRLAYGLEQL
jgi:hypothetical protein